MSDISQETSARILEAADRAGNEAELRDKVQRIIDGALTEYGLTPEVKLERVVYHGRRADVLYPEVVIEYKAPGLLSIRKKRDEALEELSDYLRGLGKGAQPSRKYVGVALDGRQIIFVRARLSDIKSRKVQVTLDNREIEIAPEFEITGPVAVNKASIEQLLLYLRQLNRDVLSPENLSRGFGARSDIGRKALPLIYAKLVSSKNQKVLTLFGEWNRIFGIVYGEALGKSKMRVTELSEEYGVSGEIELKPLLFSVHTYFALLMKMIAAEILAMQNEGLLSSFVRNWALLDDERLRNDFRYLESSGGLFRRFGITNFLEGDFFSWYLEEWDTEIASIVRMISRKLGDYEPATTRLEPEEARDLLKRLYQYLVPPHVRRGLGEFYTPDWLAELLLNEAGYNGDMDKRLLDPACGSGTFLILAIKRILKLVQDYPEKYSEGALQAILNNVVGFDINPLAVLAARTNYLIAISPLRRMGMGDIEIPVYLADSVLTPKSYSTLVKGESYRVDTVAGQFLIPRSLTSKETLGKVLEILDNVLTSDSSLEVFMTRVNPILPKNTTDDPTPYLKDLYSKILELRKEGRDTIWLRILRNNFAPLYVGGFDYVIGNPPWIHWENLSSEYREATHQLWIDYRLLPRRTGKGYLAESAVDFSQLFTYVCADCYLKKDGVLGFLITQTLFKAELRGEGFRRFELPDGTPLGVSRVNDLVALQPFEDAANKTSLFTVKKGSQTSFPVQYVLWTKSARIETSMSLPSVLANTKREGLQAYPSGGNRSPWSTAKLGQNEIISKMYGMSDYKAKIGADTLGANGVYWVRAIQRVSDDVVLIENASEAAKKNVEKVKDAVEADLVYPLLRGGDIKGRWVARPNYQIVVPHSEKTAWRPIDLEEMGKRYPKTLSFLKRFQTFLKARPSYKQRRSGYPFYIMFRIYADSFAPYKVVWQRMTNELKACVVQPVKDELVGSKPVMPSDTVTFVSFENLEEAHYLCAVLNSSNVRLAVSAYSSPGRGFGAPHILKHVRIPRYNSKNEQHLRLVDLSERAHKYAISDKESELEKVEKQIDEVVARMFGIGSDGSSKISSK